ETYDKALSGKFIYHPLLERYGEATLPEVKIIDLRHTPHSNQKHFLFSEELLAALAQNLAAKKQSLLFMNRRGFAHFVLCEDCGYRPLCPNCDISLTFHRGRKKMACHYCDYQIVPLDECPGCHGHQWLPVGSGTERIEEELQKHFPDARISRMDRDTTSQKGSHELILKKLEEGKIDILVGTQMITKGHDYPNVTLVGILLADSALNLPDFRSAERTYQLMTQVAGRSGRGIDAGQVLLQTFTPEHFSLQYAARHETKLFYDQEIELRRELEYPPFRRLIVLRLQGTQLGRVQQSIQHLKNHLDHLNQLQHWKAQILGPSPCLIEKIKNQYRWQIILKCPPGKLLQPVLRNEIMAQQKKWLSPGVRLVVDVDPIHVV
ncbi:MAG: primosomal protein N', partial [Deltaproteobacteria bacterium]|nr:primosomal protein N' [Deltaproteobacteria bacterium]